MFSDLSNILRNNLIILRNQKNRLFSLTPS
nr:MAG TPA: hypothetical protein [Caudoviricetes sp.]